MTLLSSRLEQYTMKRQEEVLMVEAETVAGELDIILIYNGFSSSLVNPTAFDPDIPILQDNAKIISIDRIASPYNPDRPTYIQQGITLSEMEKLLETVGV